MVARKKKLPARQIVIQLQRLLHDFSSKVSIGQKGTKRRFIAEAISGILLSGSSVLSRIASALLKANHSFHGIEKRLGYELHSELQTTLLRSNANQIVHHSGYLGKEPVFALDLTDINKEGSHVFECMDKVHDGSEGKLVDGYWSVVIEGIQNKGEHIPLYMDMFSTKAKGFTSINTEIKNAVEHIVTIFGLVGHWIMDRGFDSSWNFAFFSSMRLSFIIRGYKVRSVMNEGGHMELIQDIVNKTELPGRYPFYQYYMLQKNGRKMKWAKRETKIKYGYCTIKVVPNGSTVKETIPLQVIIVEGIEKAGERSYFYTNVPIRKLRDALAIAKLYGKRWGCEEGIRFVKQALALEDIRVQSYKAFQQLVVLIQISIRVCKYDCVNGK